MIRVEIIIDMVSIGVAEQGLRLLLLRRELGHGLGGQVDGTCNTIESQIELVKLLARLLEAELYCTFLTLAVTSNLIQGLVEVDDLRSHLVGKTFDAHHTENNKKLCHYDNNH